MELAFTGQSLVCVGTGVLSPDPLGLGANPLPGLGQQLSAITNPQLTMVQYETVQLVAAPGRLQLEFTAAAVPANVRQIVANALDAVRVGPVPSAIGLNVTARIDLANDAEVQTLNGILDVGEIQARINQDIDRYGIRAVWHDNACTSTMTVDPQFGTDLSWQASLNRNHDTIDQAATSLDWFGDAAQTFLAMLRRLAGAAE